MMKKNSGQINKINNEMTLSMFLHRLLFVVLWSQNTIMIYVAQIFRSIPVLGQYYESFPLFVMYSLLVFVFGKMTKKIRILDILFILGYVAMILLTVTIFPENVEHISDQMSVILTSALPMYLFGVCYEHETLKKDLFLASALGLIFAFLYLLFFLNTREMEAGSDMAFSYKILPSAMYSVYWAFEKRKLRYWALVVFSFFFLIIFGSRGPVLAFAIYFLLSLFLDIAREKKPMKIFLCFIFGLAIITLLSNEVFSAIVRSATRFFSEKGFSTRILNKLLENELTNDSGRSLVYARVINAINENTIFGLGFMGDRTVLNGAYSHNLFLEILCHFGIPLGSILILVLICFSIACLSKARKKVEFPFFLLLFVLVYTKLMISGTYTTEPYFYFMIGIGVSILRKYGGGNYEKKKSSHS